MSTSLSFGPVTMTWPWTYTLTASPNNIPSTGPWNYSNTALTNGTAAGNADTLYATQTSISASGSTTLNLSSLTNPFGTSITFARLKAMYFENFASATGLSTGLAIGGAGSTPFTGGFFNAGTDTVTLRNGMHMSVGVCQDSTGYAVGSGINLLLTNSDGSHTCLANIGLAGCSV